MKALLVAALLFSSAHAFAQIQIKCHIETIDESLNDSSVTKSFALAAGAVTGSVSVGEFDEQKIVAQISADGRGESFVSAVCVDQSQYSTLLLCAQGALEIQTVNYDKVTTTITCTTVK